jgi:hypothetical protein
LIFGNYNYQLPTSPAPFANQNNNGFVLDRAYLTFRAPAGDRLSVRVTTDVYQTTETTQNAYTIRAKYAYLQYDMPKSASGAGAFARLGILQNVVIEQLENFWPRYLSQVAIERAGYFASADVGLAAGYTLPNKMGELYGTIVNGPGYTSRERDRFKDFALRLSLTPLANSVGSPLLQTFTIMGWGYKGALASSFVNGGAGQVGAVGEALDRSRAGVFVGIRDPRLTLGGEFDVRRDGGEAGANTVASPRTGTMTNGHLVSGLVRPRVADRQHGEHHRPAAERQRVPHADRRAVLRCEPARPVRSRLPGIPGFEQRRLGCTAGATEGVLRPFRRELLGPPHYHLTVHFSGAPP